MDLALFSFSLFLSPSRVLLSRKRVESASHILENCWGHLTSWQNTFPRIGGTWSRVPLRATLSGSVSVLLPPPSRVLSLPRLFVVFFVSISFIFFFSDALCLSLPLFLNCPFYRGSNPWCISCPRGVDGYCFARADAGPYFFSRAYHRAS